MFDASAFHPELSGGRGPGSIRVESDALLFISSDDPEWVLRLAFEGLVVRLGGADDQVLFFSHPEHPDVTVFTTDHAVLDQPALASLAAVAAQITGVRAHKRRNWLSFNGAVAVIALVIVGLVLSIKPLMGFVVDQVPPSSEAELGAIVFEQVKASTRLIEDPEVDAKLEELAAPLLEAIPETGYSFELHLVEDPTLNAFAIPGGNVVLHSGLVLQAESPEEVLGVLAHEIAHVTQRHSLRQMVDTVGVLVLVQMLFGDLSGFAAVLADGGVRLLSLEFSRDHELEADAVGFDYLLAAGIDPRGMISFFEKLMAEHERRQGGAGGSVELDFLSTHPATADRIEKLSRRLAEVGDDAFGGDRADDVAFVAFQELLRDRVTSADAEAGQVDQPAG